MFEEIESILSDYFNFTVLEITFCELFPADQKIMIEANGERLYFTPQHAIYPKLVLELGFKTLDEAVEYSRTLSEPQVVFETGKLFYNCEPGKLGEDFKALVRIDSNNKEIVNIYNGPL